MRNQVELLDDRYRVLTVLAAGGSSVVYLAHHAGLGREVAIKVLRPELFSSDKDVETYLREARIIAALNHPNILTVHDVGRLPDRRPYIVMEYVPGRSMSRMLEGGQVLPVDLALDVFEQVVSALGHAHRHGVIHRDIKPANLLLRQHSTGRPQAKVADFGIASVAAKGQGHAGAYVGTPHYMSPEQAAGSPVVPASDFYSLGVLMYRALTGVRLFADDDPAVLALHHVRTVPRPFREVAPGADVPEALEAVVMRLLRKDPADRYASADLLLEALAEVRRGLQGANPLVTSQESLDPPYLLQQQRAPAPAPASTARLALPLLAAGVLFAAGVGIGFWLGG